MILIQPLLILIVQLLLPKPPIAEPLRYIAFGDSYTICTGTTTLQEHWPNLLAKHLTEAGIATQLVANPAKNGYTTLDLIAKELPILTQQSIDFATLLIGVNDWARGIDVATYHKNLNYSIDAIQQQLSNKACLVLITIPDFGVTPQGSNFGNGFSISEGISIFNAIIKAEAKKRNLLCVDIFKLSQQMKNDTTLIAKDGLHPSAKEYALWEELFFKNIKKLLSKHKI